MANRTWSEPFFTDTVSHGPDTLDRRAFRAIRPLTDPLAFRLLPDDS